MYKHILIATDGSQCAQRAVATGLRLAKVLGAKATAVTVSEPWPMARTCHGSVVVQWDARESADGREVEKALTSVMLLANHFEVECQTVHVKEHTTERIMHAATNGGCDLIVVASHNRRGASWPVDASER